MIPRERNIKIKVIKDYLYIYIYIYIYISSIINLYILPRVLKISKHLERLL